MTALNIVRSNFESVLSLRQEIDDIRESLNGKINALKLTYSDLLKHHDNSRSLFGIDSFYFQNELLEIEYSNMSGVFELIDNRLYCEYYNLFIMIQNYIKKDIKNEEIIQKTKCNKVFPVYKHLDKKRKYDINLVIELQTNIISSIIELQSYLELQESYLSNNSKHADMGLNIDNLVHFQRYTNILLKEKINMYIQYLNTFHVHHTKYFTRLLLKLKLMMGVVNEDILIKQGNKKIEEKKQRLVEKKKNVDSGDVNSIIDEISPETKSSLDKALSCINDVTDDENIKEKNVPTVGSLSKKDIILSNEKTESDLRNEIRMDILEARADIKLLEEKNIEVSIVEESGKVLLDKKEITEKEVETDREVTVNREQPVLLEEVLGEREGSEGGEVVISGEGEVTEGGEGEVTEGGEGEMEGGEIALLEEEEGIDECETMDTGAGEEVEREEVKEVGDMETENIFDNMNEVLEN